MTSDGYSNQQLIPHPIMTRAFYEEQGYFFCPEYPHLFCDTELTVRALAQGKVIDAKHLVFRHENPMFTGAKPDAMAVERNSPEAWAIGEGIFKRRNTAAPDIFGPADFADFYRQMVEMAEPGAVFVELGAYLGCSAALMLEEIKRSGKKIDFLAYDTFVMKPKWKEEAAYIEASGGNLEAACRHTIRTRTGLDPDKIVFNRDSADAANLYADGSVDFCFIDADHSEAACRRDIEAWLPKIKPGRILAGHDFDMPEVYRAVMTTLGGKYSVKQVGRVWFVVLPPTAP
jgi:predicted O-methyltransferase YrrM